ncbi:DUF695 domain-containing protein [Aquimarina sediminis]|uniref:DUF695 domain-containing protein n=1 Tax=Aquimarina sediminis TaxID=2070536 RepID=UPI0013E8E77A|nr:DUF695 domain-containing protein [Aquimarina sediminis]
MQQKNKLKIFFLLSLTFYTILSFGQSQAENWQSYIASYDENKPGSTTVRMDIANQTPIPQYDYVLVTGLTYKSTREDGFPEGKTFEVLHKVGDELVELLNGNNESILVGSFMYNFQRLEYFYLKSNKGIENKVKEFYDSNYPDYKNYINLKEDKEWTYYKEFLYPSDEILEYLGDQSVIKNLQEAGDNLSKARRVDHWAYFKNESEMESFKKELTKKGFQIQSSSQIEHKSTPFEIQFWRVDKVDINSIYPITSVLRKKAQEYNGDYDGWETSVEKE